MNELATAGIPEAKKCDKTMNLEEVNHNFYYVFLI
jgi:hypothetical protein